MGCAYVYVLLSKNEKWSMNRDIRCNAPYSLRLVLIPFIGVVGNSAIGIRHSFGDLAFRCCWGYHAVRFPSTVVSLFVFAATFFVVQELILVVANIIVAGCDPSRSY